MRSNFSLEDYKFKNGRVESSAMYHSTTFNTRMENADAEPVKVIICGCEVVDIEKQRSLIFLYSIAQLVFHAWARALAQRK